MGRRDPALRRRGHHHIAEIAAIKRRQIGMRLQRIQRLEQHLSFTNVNWAKCGVKGRIGTRRNSADAYRSTHTSPHACGDPQAATALSAFLRV